MLRKNRAKDDLHIKERRKSVRAKVKDGEGASIEDFEMLKLLGKGAFAKVWKARHKHSGKIYAIKALDKAKLIEQELIDHINLERKIMGMLGEHPYIIDLHFAFQSEETLFLVIDYLPRGSLWDLLSQQEHPFAESVAKFYGAQILLALEALHSFNFVYRYY